jgi:hypothetical protein
MFKNINVDEHDMVARGRGRPPKRRVQQNDNDDDMSNDSNVNDPTNGPKINVRSTRNASTRKQPKTYTRRPPKKYTKKEMTEMLEDYIRIDDIAEIPLYSHVRYITLDKEGCQAFRSGGYIEQVSKRFVHIKSGNLKWYVPRYHYDAEKDPGKANPIFETIFWKKRDQVDDIVDYLETQKTEIEFLKEQLHLCKEILQILKDEHNATHDSIETLKSQVVKCKDMYRRIMERVGSR